MASKKQTKVQEPSFAELMAEMHSIGSLQRIPGTERLVRMRTLDVPSMLANGKMPDILTPLVIKSVYQDITDKEVQEVIQQHKGDKEEALAMLETLDFVCKHAIADSTQVSDLTLAEKRWIFRLALGSAELLINFRYEPEFDVAELVPGDKVQQAA
jgi:hypothetical protein